MIVIDGRRNPENMILKLILLRDKKIWNYAKPAHNARLCRLKLLCEICDEFFLLISKSRLFHYFFYFQFTFCYVFPGIFC